MVPASSTLAPTPNGSVSSTVSKSKNSIVSSGGELIKSLSLTSNLSKLTLI